MRDIGQHERETRNRARLPKPNGAAVIRFGKPAPCFRRGLSRRLHQRRLGLDEKVQAQPGEVSICPAARLRRSRLSGRPVRAVSPRGKGKTTPMQRPGGKFYDPVRPERTNPRLAFPELSKAALKQMFEGSLCEIKVETVKRSWKAKKGRAGLAAGTSVQRRARVPFGSRCLDKQPDTTRTTSTTTPTSTTTTNQGNHHNPLT